MTYRHWQNMGGRYMTIVDPSKSYNESNTEGEYWLEKGLSGRRHPSLVWVSAMLSWLGAKHSQQYLAVYRQRKRAVAVF